MSPIVQENVMTPPIPPPEMMGSYDRPDVVFLLKNLNDIQLEIGTEDREEAIQSGVHYSEMLPIEYQPGEAYIALFHETLSNTAKKVAVAAGVVAEMILQKRGSGTVLVSLARAGTPIGILIKRYLAYRHSITLPHYSISIIRGKGIDENALKYMLQQHGAHAPLQFIDGWTGKGAIRKVLIDACRDFERKFGIVLNDDLAVLADPAHCSATYGTREDYLIPSACLNSTVSGLMTRTILRDDLIGPSDFHGAKFYKEWLENDLSNYFVDTVSGYFPSILEEIDEAVSNMHDRGGAEEVTWKGMRDIAAIQEAFGIGDVNLVKPGVGETTRVLLRRVPWKILVDDADNPNLRHILLLAKERGVPVEVYPGLTYSCCGIIKPLKGETD